ncbi:MAG TPA: hypothetical protein VEL76_19185 [Gemmataceae bacterium]|nr:hypothetical protein [Gemmataceae bacterium]
MRNNAVPFTALQRVLEGLGFVRKKVEGPQVVFEHAPSNTLFLFRAYKPRDQVTAADLIEVRKILDEKGVIDPEALAELLHQPSV